MLRASVSLRTLSRNSVVGGSSRFASSKVFPDAKAALEGIGLKDGAKVSAARGDPLPLQAPLT